MEIRRYFHTIITTSPTPLQYEREGCVHNAIRVNVGFSNMLDTLTASQLGDLLDHHRVTTGLIERAYLKKCAQETESREVTDLCTDENPTRKTKRNRNPA